MKCVRVFRDLSGQKGLTLIEILIVVALMSAILLILVKNIRPESERVKGELTSIRQSQLADLLGNYKLHTGQLPSHEEGLEALVHAPVSAKGWHGPYAKKETLKDAWQNPMKYERVNAESFAIRSAGTDAVFGTEDDVVYSRSF